MFRTLVNAIKHEINQAKYKKPNFKAKSVDTLLLILKTTKNFLNAILEEVRTLCLLLPEVYCSWIEQIALYILGKLFSILQSMLLGTIYFSCTFFPYIYPNLIP